MAREGLRKVILRQLKEYPDDWHQAGEMERIASQGGYMGSTATRTCRLLAEDGIIDKKYNAKGHVYYKWKKKDPVTANLF